MAHRRGNLKLIEMTLIEPLTLTLSPLGRGEGNNSRDLMLLPSKLHFAIHPLKMSRNHFFHFGKVRMPTGRSGFGEAVEKEMKQRGTTNPVDYLMYVETSLNFTQSGFSGPLLAMGREVHLMER